MSQVDTNEQYDAYRGRFRPDGLQLFKHSPCVAPDVWIIEKDYGYDLFSDDETHFYVTLAVRTDSGYTNYCFGPDGFGGLYYGSNHVSESSLIEAYKSSMTAQIDPIDSDTMSMEPRILYLRWSHLTSGGLEVKSARTITGHMQEVIDSLFFPSLAFHQEL